MSYLTYSVDMFAFNRWTFYHAKPLSRWSQYIDRDYLFEMVHRFNSQTLSQINFMNLTTVLWRSLEFSMSQATSAVKDYIRVSQTFQKYTEFITTGQDLYLTDFNISHLSAFTNRCWIRHLTLFELEEYPFCLSEFSSRERRCQRFIDHFQS